MSIINGHFNRIWPFNSISHEAKLGYESKL